MQAVATRRVTYGSARIVICYLDAPSVCTPYHAVWRRAEPNTLCRLAALVAPKVPELLRNVDVAESEYIASIMAVNGYSTEFQPEVEDKLKQFQVPARISQLHYNIPCCIFAMCYSGLCLWVITRHMRSIFRGLRQTCIWWTLPCCIVLFMAWVLKI